MNGYVLYDPEAPVVRPKRRTTRILFTPEQEQWMRDHFHDTLNQQCADHLGVSMRTMIRLARRLGLTKDPAFCHEQTMQHCTMMHRLNKGEGNSGKYNLIEAGKPYRFQPGVTPEQRLGEEKNRQRIAKSAASRRETLRKERMRVNWGLPQETRLRVVVNRKAAQIRYCLKKAGYILAGRAAREAYYTADTHRITSLEQSAQQNGITISSLFSGRTKLQ